MDINFKDQVLKSIEQKLEELNLVRQREDKAPEAAYDGPEPVATFSAEDTQNGKRFLVDSLGRRVGIGRPHGSEYLVLEESDFIRLQKIASQLKGQAKLSEVVSQSFVEEFLFDRLFSRHIGETNESLLAHLQRIIDAEVLECTFQYPLSASGGNVAFFFGGVEFLPASKHFRETMRRFRSTPVGDEAQRSGLGRKADELIDLYDSCMWASVTVLGEPSHAKQVALERLQQATSILRALCVEGYQPAHHVGLSLGQPRSSGIFYIRKVAGGLGLSDSEPDGLEFLYFNEARVDQLGELGFSNIKLILAKESRTEMDELCIKLLVLLGGVAGMQELSDKIVYGCTVLDTLFARDQNEPILANMPKRLALELGVDLAERKNIVKAVKNAYALRSGRVHHGIDAPLNDECIDFFRILFQLATRLVFLADRYTTKKQFLDELDDRMLSD